MSYNPFSLENKVIIVTGASSGIGAQCAIDCSLMGCGCMSDCMRTDAFLFNCRHLIFYLFCITGYHLIDAKAGYWLSNSV